MEEDRGFGGKKKVYIEISKKFPSVKKMGYTAGMGEVHPIALSGDWAEGFALDRHTISSVYIGDSAGGHPQFENTHSEVGELLFQLKYRSDKSAVQPLAETAVNFIRKKKWPIEIIVPVPPSTHRAEQPVFLIAKKMGNLLGVPVDTTSIKKIRATPPLKGIHDFDERMALLEGAFEINCSKIKNQKVLLFDDFYDYGSTLHTIYDCMTENCQPKAVYALTITKTKKSR